ncbi:hypothetical protein AZE42_02878 [Rhizopogon vesiculosus]|uniref:Uncharacterized protein n=1 Tax=Rhizopogon vesiculosus TaxID=180088 RepID=A0A1J8PY92_9AGAM|nr:hypothetical protein AZE42_02878 [Rhizopogon vesiculosus]
MPRAQNVSSQPSDLIDGHATLIAAHVICSTPSTHLDRPSTSSGIGDDEMTSSGSRDSEGVSMYSADSDSCNGLLTLDSPDGLNLPLQAHMLPGRGRWHYAVLPVLLVADAPNIVPLLCSTLYQRRVWGVREPVVGLCCSNTGTTATAIFGWLDPGQSEEGCLPVVHLALAACDSVDPSIGVFDFTDSYSVISMAQFILSLRSHFQDIKDIASIEAVDSLTPFHWRSDLPNFFETQMGAQSGDRVALWTHEVHVQNSSSETLSSSCPCTPSPLSDPHLFLSSEEMAPRNINTIYEDDVGRANTGAPQSTHATDKTRVSSKDASGSHKSSSAKSPSRYSNSVFAAHNDAGLGKRATISNWLFERNTFTVGHIAISPNDRLAEYSGINAMVEMHDQITAFSWSDGVEPELLDSTIDCSVSGVRDRLFEESRNHPSTNTKPTIKMPEEDVKFISARLSALLHAAERRHEWDALLLKFFQPVAGQRDVLLERKLNFPSNLAVGDTSFAQQAMSLTRNYELICRAQEQACFQQRFSLPPAEEVDAMEDQHLSKQGNFLGIFAVVSRRTIFWMTLWTIPVGNRPTGHLTLSLSSHVLVSPLRYSNAYMEPDKQDAPSQGSEHQENKAQKTLLQDVYRVHPDQMPATNRPSENARPEAGGHDLLLPGLLSEYKKKDKSTIAKAMNQMRTYLVSAIRFLDALGITEQPVFGLVVNGRLGAITMAWQKNEKIYIMERNVRHYDITDPLQAFQFVSVLLRLARYGLVLRACFDEKKDALCNSLRNRTYTPWSKLAQIEGENLQGGGSEAAQAEQR